MDNLFAGLGVEILLPDEDAFLKIRETLQRIGVASKKSNTLYQSCHILHKQGRYSIMMFKELFVLDGKKSDIELNDLQRRNTIVKLLEDWGLVQIINRSDIEDQAPLSQIKIISYVDKEDWELCAKYTIGKKRQHYY